MKSSHTKPRRANQGSPALSSAQLLAQLAPRLGLTGAQQQALKREYIIGNAGLREFGIGLDRTHIWDLIQAKRFPKPDGALGTGPYAVKIWKRPRLKKWLSEQPLVRMARKVGT
jgi:hypothetical protein